MPQFTEEDIYQFYKDYMEIFISSIKYTEFLDEFPDSNYPINDKILKKIYYRTDGNPRAILKFLIKIFNEIINSDEKLEDIQINYE